ncbi:hypothetical protein B7494_g4442 [Chlorociboria aeruginascens]|nr:hypothetical protein B7494_g4442 [Chlorociboria aeruginascens]
MTKREKEAPYKKLLSKINGTEIINVNMLLSRLQLPLRSAVALIGRSNLVGAQQICLSEAFAQLSIKQASSVLTFVRHSTSKSQGAVNKAKDGAGRRLGAKKSGEQYVIPGNIIFRQRGTHWFPGDNCAMGRDHTIYATESGYVKYYKDPDRHPKRQYIGVVFERDQILPLPRNSRRRRRLGMEVSKMDTPASEEVQVRTDLVVESDGGSAVSVKQTPNVKKAKQWENLKIKSGYMYRQSNWEIGRAAERANVKVEAFKPGNRWLAWRKANARKLKTAEKRGLRKG